MTDVTGAFAEGDHSGEIEGAENMNKIGQKAQAVQVFKFNDIETLEHFRYGNAPGHIKRAIFQKLRIAKRFSSIRNCSRVGEGSGRTTPPSGQAGRKRTQIDAG